MRSFIFIFISAIAAFAMTACGEPKPSSPLDTFKAYTKAIQQKDTNRMKLLLSADSIKMHEQEAKSQGVTLDEVLKRETLFTQNQKSVDFRNENIAGDKATMEVKNSFGAWETVPFVKEEGEWKIDKKGFANQMMQEIEQNDKKIDDIINQGRQP